MNPESTPALIGRGQCFLRKQDAANAVRDFSNAIAVAPNNIDALTGRATAYLLLRQF
ncbi:MAG TPA: hypothetical protein PLY87_06510 [Planctomycetaceae bacterium]|nr:hypothetical protein [Planctomycetaceae bacterium]HQZ64706.1 hypothetical protein [Planctomycetaceae bacterium]